MYYSEGERHLWHDEVKSASKTKESSWCMGEGATVNTLGLKMPDLALVCMG